MNIEEAGHAFLEHCQAERQHSLNTLAAYRQDVAELVGHMGQIDVKAVTGPELVAFAAHLSGPRALAPATVKRRMACTRSLFGWLLRRGTIEANPFAAVEIRIRIPDRLPRCLPTADMARLAQAAEATTPLTRLSHPCRLVSWLQGSHFEGTLNAPATMTSGTCTAAWLLRGMSFSVRRPAMRHTHLMLPLAAALLLGATGASLARGGGGDAGSGLSPYAALSGNDRSAGVNSGNYRDPATDPYLRVYDPQAANRYVAPPGPEPRLRMRPYYGRPY